MKRRSLLLITAKLRGALLAGLSLMTSVGAATAAEVMVIVDGSGSSAGQIGGVPKIDIARSALATVLADSPENLSIGLVAYGHRREEACDDVQLLAPPGAPDAFLAAATTIRSVGRSPIALAVETAAGAITDPEQAATIILITDNSDNCAPDPCETVANIAERMPNLMISVLGIAVPDNEVADIACFTELTGGTFLRADNAASFNAALDEIMRAAWGPPPPPPPTATIAFPFDVIQGATFTIDYDGPAAPGDTMRIAWVGSPATDYIASAAIPSDGRSIEMTAPNMRGAFELRYWHAERGTVLARMPLPVGAIVPAIAGPKRAEIGADVVVSWEVDAQGGETIEIADALTPPGSSTIVAEAIRTQRSVTLTAPGEPGIYELRLVAAPIEADEAPEIRTNDRSRILAVTEIEIVAANIDMSVEGGTIFAGAPMLVDWTGPGGRFDEIRLAAAGSPSDAFLAVAAAHEDDAIRFHAPTLPGDYELRYWSAATEAVVATQPIIVTQPEATLTAPAEVRGGTTFAIEWTGPGNPGDAIAILDSSGATIESWRLPLFGEPVTVDAPIIADSYVIAYLPAGSDMPITATTLTVGDPAARLTVAGSIETGGRLVVRWDGPNGRFDELRLIGPGEDGPVVEALRLPEAATVEWTAPEETGLYQVQYWSVSARAALATATVDVVCSQCDEPLPAGEPELRLTPVPADPTPTPPEPAG